LSSRPIPRLHVAPQQSIRVADKALKGRPTPRCRACQEVWPVPVAPRGGRQPNDRDDVHFLCAGEAPICLVAGDTAGSIISLPVPFRPGFSAAAISPYFACVTICITRCLWPGSRVTCIHS